MYSALFPENVSLGNEVKKVFRSTNQSFKRLTGLSAASKEKFTTNKARKIKISKH